MGRSQANKSRQNDRSSGKRVRKAGKRREGRRKPFLVGITGGIGAGKSEVASLYRKLGYPVFSADEIAREIVAPGSPALREIRRLFGPGSLREDGSLDRAFVRARIAESPGLRRKLEAITHPRIQRRALRLARDAQRSGAGVVFYEAPLLFEAGGDRRMDKVICVHARDRLRLERVRKRDGGSLAQARKLLASQMPQREKMRRADFLVANEGSRKELEAAALAVLGRLAPLNSNAPGSPSPAG